MEHNNTSVPPCSPAAPKSPPKPPRSPPSADSSPPAGPPRPRSPLVEAELHTVQQCWFTPEAARLMRGCNAASLVG
eukprot:765442-Pelagomonas_calceolata.AAC.1